MLNKWLTLKEAAAYMGASPSWLYKESARLGIPRATVGKTYRYNPDKLDQWLEGGTKNA
jgi:excisionase family DNA binding protein